MKVKILITFLFVSLTLPSYAGYNPNPYTESEIGLIWNDSYEPQFRIPAAFELESVKKLTVARQEFLTMIDEYNREQGIAKRYVQDYYGKVPEYNEDVDIVPIWIEKIEYPAVLKPVNPIYLRQDQVEKVLKNSEKNQEMMSLFSKEFDNKNQYRFYFGNGNAIDNLIFEDKTQFNISKNQNTKYLLDGKYKLFTKVGYDTYNFNPLGITKAEYEQYFLKDGKSVSKDNPELVDFMKTKLEAKGIVVTKKGNELYTTVNGKDRRILWNAYTLSIPKKDFSTDNKYYQNTILTRIFLFDEYETKDEIAYKKNGDIILKDIFSDSTTSAFKMGWEDLTLDNISGKAKNYNEKLKDDYLAFKEGKMLEKDFKQKWSFIDDSFEVELAPIKTVSDNLAVKQNDLNIKIEELGGKGGWDNFTLYYRYFEASIWSVPQNEKDAIYAGTDEQAKKYMQEKGIDLVAFKALLDSVKQLRIDKDNLENDLSNKISNITIKRFSTEDLKNIVKGKEILLGGQGRVNNIIDLGNGFNTLIINENDSQYTGKFGTNIILGANTILKNINIIGVGRQESATTGASGLSGITSLSLEIDKNKYNRYGHLYQHPLKDTWEDFGKRDKDGNLIKPNRIVFAKADASGYGLSDIYRNDFVIEFRTSGISKDKTIIDMGRLLEYKDDFEGYKYKINLMPDTITQNFIILREKSVNGHDLIQVEFKDFIKQLSNEKNAIYRSIVKSGDIDVLVPTLSTSNKKTLFSTAEADKKEYDKNMILALALKDDKKTAEEILYNLADFEIKGEKKLNLLEKINALKFNKISSNFSKKEKENAKNAFEKNIQNYRGMSKTLVKYKKIDTSAAKKAMQTVVNEFSYIPENLNGAEDLLKERLGGTPYVALKVEQLKKIYKEHIEPFYNQIIDAEPNKANGEAEINVKIPSFPTSVEPAKILRGQYGSGGLKNLVERPESTPEEQLKKLVSYYRIYLNSIKQFEELAEKYINEKMLSDLQREELFKIIRAGIFYTQRQVESLNEFEILLQQFFNENIYAKINKISKDEIDIFTSLMRDSKFDFVNQKAQIKGGAFSGRFAKDEFKGTIYSGYSFYETPMKDNLTFGFILGGGNSDFHEIINDDNQKITTNSTIKGSRVYLGGFERHKLGKNFIFINGIGLQFSFYDIEREMKNHYQYKKYKGDASTYTANFNSCINYIFQLNENFNINFKGGLNYTVVKQKEIKEKEEKLSMIIKQQNFDYLDGMLGIGVTKNTRGNKKNSSLSGTLLGVYGLIGYDNDNLKACFNGSSSDFDIQGKSYKKASVNLTLDYNVIYDAGFNYGLEGSYTQNSNEDNISVGVKAGYAF